MFMKRFTSTAVFWILVTLLAPVFANSTDSGGEWSAVLSDKMQAVVNLLTLSASDPSGALGAASPAANTRSSSVLKIGSGVIIDAQNGYVVTNAHVIDSSSPIVVTLNNGQKLIASPVGIDKDTDIAVIKIDATVGLTALKFASREPRLGEAVATIGSPFGLAESVSTGIISGRHRTGIGLELVEDFFQTDAEVNFGNSGGAMINKDGDLVGINTALIASNFGSGVGLAINGHMVKLIVDQLIKYHNVERGKIGLMVQSLEPGLAGALKIKRQQGALVTSVSENGPAAKAGIESGDVVVSIEGQKIENNAEVVEEVGSHRRGSEINLQILRNGELIPFKIKVVAPDELEENNNGFFSKFFLENVSISVPGLGFFKGVQVDSLRLSPIAAALGIASGDIILGVDGKGICSIAELNAKIAKRDGGFSLKLLKGSSIVYLFIPSKPENHQ